jgi:histidine ammonia-lyase
LETHLIALLAELLATARALEPMALWAEREPQVRSNYEAMARYAAANPAEAIYGLNTLPGHRDSQKLSSDEIGAFQEKLLANHVIEGFVFAPEFAVRCIGYAKATQVAAVGPFISGELYGGMCEAVRAPRFRPLVPMGCSYSSGDVIPAAHWAQGLLDFCRSGDRGFRLKPGESMALINGSFVHVGMAAFALDEMKALWSMLIETARLDVSLAGIGARNLAIAGSAPSGVLRYIADEAADDGRDRQPPVSFRAIPQIVDTLSLAVVQFAEQTNAQLLVPSGNPVMAETRDGIVPCSQGSFLAPMLSVATGAVMEALQFALWASVERTKFLLSGAVPSVSLDGASATDALGFIQWPKYLQALLEDIRLKWGRATFASGGDTSYGTEDLWTLGLSNLDRLREGVALGERLCALGLVLRLRLCKQREGGAAAPDWLVHAIPDGAQDAAARVMARFREETPAGRFYPV